MATPQHSPLHDVKPMNGTSKLDSSGLTQINNNKWPLSPQHQQQQQQQQQQQPCRQQATPLQQQQQQQHQQQQQQHMGLGGDSSLSSPFALLGGYLHGAGGHIF
ncbi:hypothetical protein FOCC_FOCC001567 [Frankliniella occidentalis]|nr:hypothetical protein FOCC_FOCC001567 [Frankliniella occidentalis]